jgi:hypothetical protein
MACHNLSPERKNEMEKQKPVDAKAFCVDAPNNDVNKFKAERKATDHETTNLLLGHIAGHMENLVTEEKRSYDRARHNHEEWQEMFIKGVGIQTKNQKIGLIVVVGGICFLSTIISVVVSLLL